MNPSAGTAAWRWLDEIGGTTMGCDDDGTLVTPGRYTVSKQI